MGTKLEKTLIRKTGVKYELVVLKCPAGGVLELHIYAVILFE